MKINIQLTEDERILTAFNVQSSDEIKDSLIAYLNSRVNDYEQSVEMQKVAETYTFVPLIEIQDEVTT